MKPNNVVLQCKHGVKFEIDKAIAMQSETIKNLLEQCNDTDAVHLDVTGPVLSKIIQYWDMQARSGTTRWEVSMRSTLWRVKFEDNVEEVMELAMAANYLNCRELIGVTRKMVENITPEDAAIYFGGLSGFEEGSEERESS